jgi:hypothetical protein
MGLARIELGTWKDRVGRAATAAVLGSLIFMLGAAGSKNSPSLPPTVNPAVACKRPKTATPYFPSVRARDLLRAKLAPFAMVPPLEACRAAREFTTQRARPEAEGRDSHAMTSPRYLRPHLASVGESSVSPPA